MTVCFDALSPTLCLGRAFKAHNSLSRILQALGGVSLNGVDHMTMMSSHGFPLEQASQTHDVAIEIGLVPEQTLVAGETLTLECFTSGR